MYFTSSSVTYGPAGRHMPTLKISSLTPLVYAGALAYTGCLCIGFQTGRVSIFFSCMKTLRASTLLFGWQSVVGVSTAWITPAAPPTAVFITSL